MYSELVVGECPFCMSEKERNLCHHMGGQYTEVFKGRDRIGFYIAGVGDTGFTDKYYPKFCPECGRRINWDIADKKKLASSNKEDKYGVL